MDGPALYDMLSMGQLRNGWGRWLAGLVEYRSREPDPGQYGQRLGRHPVPVATPETIGWRGVMELRVAGRSLSSSLQKAVTSVAACMFNRPRSRMDAELPHRAPAPAISLSQPTVRIMSTIGSVPAPANARAGAGVWLRSKSATNMKSASGATRLPERYWSISRCW